MKHNYFDPNIQYDFGNLGFPSELSLLANKMVKEYRENNKILFVKTKFQQAAGVQLLKFNSPAIRNTIILVFNKTNYGSVDLTNVEVIVKTDQEPSYNNFTKPRKAIIKKVFDLKHQMKECVEYIKPFLWLDDNFKWEERVLDCKLGLDGLNPDPKILSAARIASYEIIDQNTIELKLNGNNKIWYYRVNAGKVTAFTMIKDLAGMLLVFSPDGDYKIVGKMLERRLNLI